MDDVKIIPSQELQASVSDDLELRDRTTGKSGACSRNLTSQEIDQLHRQGNIADNWANVRVAGEFDASRVRNCCFAGIVRLGAVRDICLQADGVRYAAGLYNSRITSCDIGDDCALYDVRHMGRYVVGDRCVLAGVDELLAQPGAVFGLGLPRGDGGEESRAWIEVINEAGGRGILPTAGMIPADAMLWARYRGDAELQDTLIRMADAQAQAARARLGSVGDGCVIRACRILRDAAIGPGCRIRGADRLENVTIASTPQEPVEIGEGVELVDGVVGPGCRISGGARATRFVLGVNCTLKLGARLQHTVLGDNSTIACCEVLHNLVFPSHEQHHNNSFLIASLVMGQSNIAAGATIGSNHNSRANDGEIHAARGFWPGLCTSLKHNSRFASFTLLAKGDYGAELDIPLPFALVSDDRANDCLRILPAYWWMHNMYALARNSWKFATRDRRKKPVQHIEFEALAPDTADEILQALKMLETWTAEAWLRREGQNPAERTPDSVRQQGRQILSGPAEELTGLEVLADGVENSRRKVIILKPAAAYRAYLDMLCYYAVKNLLAYLEANPCATLTTMGQTLRGSAGGPWINLGGQIVPSQDVRKLIEDIKAESLETWDAVHARYDELWSQYPLARQRHAYALLLHLIDEETLTPDTWQALLDEARRIQEFIGEQVLASRQKDYDDPYRQMVYDDEGELRAVIGSIKDNSFIKQVQRATAAFAVKIDKARQLAP